MDKTHIPDTFEGSPKAREFIARLGEFIETELKPLAQAHGVDHENSPSRELLQQIERATGYRIESYTLSLCGRRQD